MTSRANRRLNRHDNDDIDKPKPLPSSVLWRSNPTTGSGVALALSCAAEFMVVLDVAIVNVALPSIQRDLALRQSMLQWVVIGYGLVLGGFLGSPADGRPLLAGFRAAFFVIVVVAAVGAVAAAIAFRGRAQSPTSSVDHAGTAGIARRTLVERAATGRPASLRRPTMSPSRTRTPRRSTR
jgi:hypothetical protein